LFSSQYHCDWKAADVAFKTTGKVILQKDGALFFRGYQLCGYPTLSKAKRTYYRFRKLKTNQFLKAILGAMETADRWNDEIYELMKRKWYWTSINEQILLKRYLNVNTSLEIKTGVTYGDWYSVRLTPFKMIW
jgi:hypothetical protein